MKSIHTEIYQNFLKRLKQARIDANLSQTEAAKLFPGRQHNTFISKCERGETRVDIYQLYEFAKIYIKSILYFIDFFPEELKK